MSGPYFLGSRLEDDGWQMIAIFRVINPDLPVMHNNIENITGWVPKTRLSQGRLSREIETLNMRDAHDKHLDEISEPVRRDT